MVQVLKETSYDYQSFVREMIMLVSQRMGEEYSPRIIKVTKNNNLELDSLVLLKAGRNYAPNIYILPYYEAYLSGAKMEELAERLCEIYHNCLIPMDQKDFTFSYEDMKSKIIYRLVNYEKNLNLLESIPHLKYLDLAITYHCLIHNDKDGIGTIRITNEHLKDWNVNFMDLQRCASANTMKFFPPLIRSMDEVIKEMFREELSSMELSDELRYTLLNLDGKEKAKMYVLSNAQGINGATSLIYQNVLKKFSEQIKSDFYILPSSIHEVILIPYDKSVSKDSLTEMVKEVNQTQVAWDEVLSDKVYYYSRANNAILV